MFSAAPSRTASNRRRFPALLPERVHGGAQAPSRDARSVRLTMLAGLLIAAATLTQAEQPTLEVHANRDRIYLGESLLLEVKVGGTSQPGEPDLTAIKDCTVEALGSQDVSHQSIFIVNGQMRREGFVGRTFTYRLTPAHDGRIMLGPITVQADGATLTRAGPMVTVTGIAKQDAVMISVTASREAVLVDEPFDIRLAVLIRRLPGEYAGADPILATQVPNLNAPFLNLSDIDGLTMPDIRRMLNERVIPSNQPGFSINDYTAQSDMLDFDSFFNRQTVPAHFRLDRRPVEQNGKSYWEYSLTLPYTAVTEGAYTFGPVVFKGNVPFAVAPGGQAQASEIFAVGPAAIVRVVPPPEKNRPESYIGAIGSNLTLTATLDAQTCNVGDPLKLTLSLSGNVQMRNLTPPKLSLQTNLLAHFEIYDDNVQASRENGNRQYAYTLRPRSPGAFELPPVEVSYFNVRDRQYHTVTSDPIPIKVRQAAEVTASQVIGGSTNASVQARHQEDILMQPAGIRMAPSGTEDVALTGNPLMLAAIASSGPALLLVALLVRLYRRHRADFERAHRRRRALRCARRRLHAPIPAGDTIHTTICRAMRQYLADRFDIATESVTPEEAYQLLLGRRVPPALSRRFSDLMQAHVEAAFGSRSAPGLPDIEAILAEVDKTTAHDNSQAALSARHGAARAGLLALCLLPGATSDLRASESAELDFIWSEACSRMASATIPQDFLDAAATYQKLVDRGIRHPSLFFNQGTALLLAGKPDDAIQALLRAERYGGSAPDIRRNLAIAQGKKENMKAPLVPWNRIVLFWHYALPCRTRALIAVAAFTLLWGAGALRVLGVRRLAKTMAILATLALVIFGSSVLTTVQQESNVARPLSLRPSM